MAIIPPRFNPNQPIPNNPFYSPLTTFIQSATGPLVIGSGLTVDFATSEISSTGGGGGGVTNIVAGAGITVTPPGGTGAVTVAVTTPAVTAVTASVPLVSSGGLTPDISMSPSGVSAGTYTNADIVVDTFGRVTSAASGSPGGVTSVTGTAPITVTAGTTPVVGVETATTGQLGAVRVGTNIDVAAGVISVKNSSTSQSGIVQLNNTVSSTSTTEALTANQGKSLQDQINALTASGGLTLAGTFNAATSQMLTVSSAGALAGFAVGSNLPTPAAGNLDYFVIATTTGSYSPPGGGGPYSVSQGDWLLSNGTTWQYLNVGADLPAASSGTPGIVELATLLETQTGTDSTIAVTPAGAAGTYVPITSYTGKGVILSASGANVTTALGVGTDNQMLVACGAATSGLCWVNQPAAAIPCACITDKGSLVTGTAAGVPVALPVGANGQILTACSACTTGLTWAPGPPVAATPTVAGIVLGCTNATNAALGCNALLSNTGDNNVAVGLNAGCANTTGCSSVYIGENAGCAATGSFNTVVGAVAYCDAAAGSAQSVTAIGAGALRAASGGGGCASVAVGVNAGQRVTTGTFNTLVGVAAGSFLTTGNSNVGIGPFVQFASPTASCQLAIGYGTGAYWLTGDSNKHIQPGAGIRDCAGNLGTSGQVLTSTGTALLWSSPTFTSAGTVQAVGLTATSAAPNVGTTIQNDISYRQIGLKEWEVVGTIYQSSVPGASNGSGDYLFTLPAGLQFNLSLAYQQVWTSAFTNGWVFSYSLPGGWASGGFNSDGWYGSTGIVPYSATTYRILVSTVSSANFWSSGFYGFTSSPPLRAKWNFTFFTP
jgi:hypothetical protein